MDVNSIFRELKTASEFVVQEIEQPWRNSNITNDYLEESRKFEFSRQFTDGIMKSGKLKISKEPKWNQTYQLKENIHKAVIYILTINEVEKIANNLYWEMHKDIKLAAKQENDLLRSENEELKRRLAAFK